MQLREGLRDGKLKQDPVRIKGVKNEQNRKGKIGSTDYPGYQGIGKTD
jgi:hypothetical protein